MKTFSTFHFKSHIRDPETMQAHFVFSFDDEVEFTETIDFACKGFTPVKNIDEQIISNLLFHLSLAVGISYYKLCPTKELVVENGYLDNEEKAFWKTFYVNGLGEYFYRNQISPKNIVQFVNEKQAENFGFLRTLFSADKEQAMIAIGGGKDSLVSIELWKKTGIPFLTSTFGKDYYLHQIVSEKLGVPRLIMQRTMDSKLFEMNAQGYYNGHVPISGIIAFALVTAAYLYDYKYIVMSNEKSANEGNTTLDGVEINHQRSKSLEFEKAFAQYLGHSISENVKYFSLLRGMYEIKIAQLFAQYPRYFKVFSSCNTNFKILEESEKKRGSITSGNQRRCGHCPKCAFVYAILRPFLTKEQSEHIWGKELYEDDTLLPVFQALLGIQGLKPRECVGTNEEVALAMKKSYDLRDKKYQDELPVILHMFTDQILPQMQDDDFDKLETKLMQIYHEDVIPEAIRALLFP